MAASSPESEGICRTLPHHSGQTRGLEFGQRSEPPHVIFFQNLLPLIPPSFKLVFKGANLKNTT